MNRRDPPGQIMFLSVWLLISYSGVTITLLSQLNNLPPILAVLYCTLCSLSLACHAKTSFTDPGAVPQSALPLDTKKKQPQQQRDRHLTPHGMCSHCQTYKPPFSHHCRICNRCISHMDHHCPWMNNWYVQYYNNSPTLDSCTMNLNCAQYHVFYYVYIIYVPCIVWVLGISVSSCFHDMEQLSCI